MQLPFQLPEWRPERSQLCEIDYISLVRACSKLLTSIRTELDEQLGEEYRATLGVDSNTGSAGNVVMAMGILNEASNTQYLKEEASRSRDRLLEDPQLEFAGVVMQKYSKKHVAEGD